MVCWLSMDSRRHQHQSWRRRRRQEQEERRPLYHQHQHGTRMMIRYQNSGRQKQQLVGQQ